jgi:hypothetical protein
VPPSRPAGDDSIRLGSDDGRGCLSLASSWSTTGARDFRIAEGR